MHDGFPNMAATLNLVPQRDPALLVSRRIRCLELGAQCVDPELETLSEHRLKILDIVAARDFR